MAITSSHYHKIRIKPGRRSPIQIADVSVGILMVLISLQFFASDSDVVGGLSQPSLFIIFGLMAIWAGFSKNERHIYVINLCLGILLLLWSVALGTLQFLDIYFFRNLFDGDIRLVNIALVFALGILFFVLSRKWIRRHPSVSQTIEDFEP